MIKNKNKIVNPLSLLRAHAQERCNSGLLVISYLALMDSEACAETLRVRNGAVLSIPAPSCCTLWTLTHSSALWVYTVMTIVSVFECTDI